MFVCLSAGYLKNDADRIIKLDVGLPMFHDESWKPFYSGVKMSSSRVNNSSAGMGLCTLVIAGFF